MTTCILTYAATVHVEGQHVLPDGADVLQMVEHLTDGAGSAFALVIGNTRKSWSGKFRGSFTKFLYYDY